MCVRKGDLHGGILYLLFGDSQGGQKPPTPNVTLRTATHCDGGSYALKCLVW